MKPSNSGPERSGRTTLITLGGDLTIGRVAEIKGIILKALDAGECLVLQISGCKTMDFSFLQLLCSAHRTASRSDKFLKLDDTLPELFFEAVDEAGYFRERGCAYDRHNDCLLQRR